MMALFTFLPKLSNAQTYASIPYSTGFETGALDASWTAVSSQAGTNIEVILTGTLTWSTQTAYSHTGNYFLGMDYGTGGSYNLNQADLHLNTLGSSNLYLQFWWAEWNDETEAQDGIYISDNGGTSFTKIQDLNGTSYTDLTWTYFNLNLDSVNTVHGLAYSSNYIVRFQQYDNYYFAGGNDGFLFDDIEISSPCPTSTSSINPIVCSSYTVPSGDETYNTSGTYTDTIPNAAGCDSIITIDLVILSTTASINPIVCSTYTVPSGDETYTISGTYTDTIPNAAGCDSIISIDLTVNMPSSSSITDSSCDTYTSTGGNTYTITGIYTETYTNASGCDSIVTLDLTINYSSTSVINESVMNSFTAPSGAVYNTSGTYMDTISNAVGCDSIITINLTVNFAGTAEYGQNLIQIYPNPTNGPLSISGLDQLASIKTIQVYDLNGRIVLELEKGTSNFSISTLDAGVYYVIVQHELGNTRIPIIKQ